MGLWAFFVRKTPEQPRDTNIVTIMTLLKEENRDLATTDAVKLQERDAIRHVRMLLTERAEKDSRRISR